MRFITPIVGSSRNSEDEICDALIRSPAETVTWLAYLPRTLSIADASHAAPPAGTPTASPLASFTKTDCFGGSRLPWKSLIATIPTVTGPPETGRPETGRPAAAPAGSLAACGVAQAASD